MISFADEGILEFKYATGRNEKHSCAIRPNSYH